MRTRCKPERSLRERFSNPRDLIDLREFFGESALVVLWRVREIKREIYKVQSSLSFHVRGFLDPACLRRAGF